MCFQILCMNHEVVWKTILDMKTKQKNLCIIPEFAEARLTDVISQREEGENII